MRILIDGDASVGKTTLAHGLMKYFSEKNFVYISTGEYLRTLTAAFLEDYNSGLEEFLSLSPFQYITWEIPEVAGKCVFYFQGKRFENIYSEKVTSFTPYLAKLIAENIVETQLLHEVWVKISEGRNCIMDGRSLGRTVFPRERFKIFLTADPVVRAKRVVKDMELNLINTVDGIVQRDFLDNTRINDAMGPAPDSFCIDVTAMTSKEVLERVISYIGKRLSCN